MNLTNKEIALELTKLYVSHINTRVEHGRPNSNIDSQNISEVYKDYYQTVSTLESSNK